MFGEFSREAPGGKPLTDEQAGGEPSRLAALRRFELLDSAPEDAFDQITRLAAKLLNVPIALISLIDEDRQWFKARVGLSARETPREHAFCAHAIQGEGVFIVEDATRDARFSANPLVTGDPAIRFYAGAPLRTSDGHALGTICVIDREARPGLSASEEEALRDLSAMVMTLIEARQVVGFQHPVTALRNRFGFLRDIDAFLSDPTRTPADRGGPRIGVAVIDTAASHEYAALTRTLGQALSDAFEIAAAERIAAALPPQVKLYHLSAARFACALPDDAVDERATLDRVTEALRAPLVCHDIPITTTKSAGIAWSDRDADHALNLDHTDDRGGNQSATHRSINRANELLRAAISAAHQALEERKPWRAYSTEQDHASRRAFQLLRDMTAALEGDGQLHLLYQPKIDLRSGRCVGVEALVRWTHPTLGPISPAEFVPLAERTALVRPLTDWVLDRALAQTARWRADGVTLRPSINISMLDLEANDFADRVAALLRRHGVRPDWIDFEVTESALMRDRKTVSHQFARIRCLGIEFEIDDFGTGQSALSYLKAIPASVVKIDQLFVRSLAEDVNDQVMVRSTIDLAHALGLRVVAEGIETAEVYDWLRDQGCDIGQGYLMSRPLTPDGLVAWLAARDGGV